MSNPFISIAEVKQQCYLDESDVSEDSYLEMLSLAAIRKIENHTNRKLYLTEAEVPAEEENALIWSEDLKIGALLLIGHFYENREATSDKTVNSIPFGFEAMVSPYRYLNV